MTQSCTVLTLIIRQFWSGVAKQNHGSAERFVHQALKIASRLSDPRNKHFNNFCILQLDTVPSLQQPFRF